MDNLYLGNGIWMHESKGNFGLQFGDANSIIHWPTWLDGSSSSEAALWARELWERKTHPEQIVDIETALELAKNGMRFQSLVNPNIILKGKISRRCWGSIVLDETVFYGQWKGL